MNILVWVGRIVLFLLVLSFSFHNTDPVVVRWFPGLEVQLPIVLALLCAFLIGLLLAWLMLLPSWLRARRDATLAIKTLIKTEKESQIAETLRQAAQPVSSSSSSES